MAIDPLRDELAVIKNVFPELETLRLSGSMTESQFTFLLRSMALAYRAGKEHALTSIQTKVGQA